VTLKLRVGMLQLQVDPLRRVQVVKDRRDVLEIQRVAAGQAGLVPRLRPSVGIDPLGLGSAPRLRRDPERLHRVLGRHLEVLVLRVFLERLWHFFVVVVGFLHKSRRRPPVLVRQQLQLEEVAVAVLLECRQRALLVLVPALPLDHEHFVLGLPAIDYAHTGGFLLAGGPLDAKECHSDFEPDSLDTREALDDADNLVVRLHNAKHMSAGNRRKAKAWEATHRSGAHFFRWKVAGSDSRGFCRRGKLVGL